MNTTRIFVLTFLALSLASIRVTAADLTAFSFLGDRNGLAIDFINNRMVVNDDANVSNQYSGEPQGKLRQRGEGVWLVDPLKGLDLGATKDFSIAMPLSLFPFNRNALHVYARFTLNTVNSAEQRYLLMLSNAGANRFAVYTTHDEGFRWVTGDGRNADTEISRSSLQSSVEIEMIAGADSYGRTWVDDGGIQTDDLLHQVSVAEPIYLGIGSYPDRPYRLLDGYLAEIAIVTEDIPMEKRLIFEADPELYAAEGDSHTRNVSFGLNDDNFYPAIVGQLKKNTVVRNHGKSGDSSAQMLAQVDDFLSRGVPDIATIYAGSNDVDTEIAMVTDQRRFSVLIAEKLAVGSWVRVNGERARIADLHGSDISLETPLSNPPRVGDKVEIDTEMNISEWVRTLQAAGVSRVAVVGSHYLNFPTGGDTPEAEQSRRANVRISQKAAATACGVYYVDTYAFMRNLIERGDVAQGDWAAWHQGEKNTHLTVQGEVAIADAILAWISTH